MPANAIESLTLSHFRSHLVTRLALDGRPVVLFGPNGAGKTNILEAVSLLSPGRGLRRATPEEMARRPEAAGWKVSASLRAGSRLHEIATWAEPGASRIVHIDGKPTPQAALGRIARVLWLVPAMDRLWTEGAEGRRRFLDRVTLSFEPGHGEAVLTYDRAMRERNRLLRDHVHDDAWYAGLEAQMAQAGEAIATNREAALRRIAAATEGAESAFPAAALALTGPGGEAEAVGAEALAAALAAGRRRDMAAARTLVGPHRTDLLAIYAAKGLPAAQCSTGEQKALLVSLVLANARALAMLTGAAPILLLDEVAAHLDEDRRRALYEEIVSLDAQAWMTGTGADLFVALAGRAQGFGVQEQGGLSRVEPQGLP
jgi:DNA replication and repair protein RecF